MNQPTGVKFQATRQSRIFWDKSEWEKVAAIYYPQYQLNSELLHGARRQVSLNTAQVVLAEDRRRPIKGDGQLYSITDKLMKVYAEVVMPKRLREQEQVSRTVSAMPVVIPGRPIVPPDSLRGIVQAAAKKAGNTGLEDLLAHTVIKPAPMVSPTPPPAVPMSTIIKAAVREELAGNTFVTRSELAGMEARILAAVQESTRKLMVMWLGDAAAASAAVASVLPAVSDELGFADLSNGPSVTLEVKPEVARRKKVLIVGTHIKQPGHYQEKLPELDVVVARDARGLKHHGDVDLVWVMQDLLSKPLEDAVIEEFKSRTYFAFSGGVAKAVEEIRAKLLSH